jgi:nucleoside-diphosphate-sugar epimerase
MRVLVTGAAGFVGSHVARLLVQERCEVLALVRPGSDLWRIADIESRVRLLHGDFLRVNDIEDSLRILKPDVCIHLGWYAKPGEYLHSVENIDLVAGTARLASKLAEVGCRRFVGVGTCFEYDTAGGYLSERAPLAPRFLYSACKAATFMMLTNLPLKDMTVAWARLFYLYGPFENERRLVPSVIYALLRGQEARCTRGEQVRDFLHVEDLASALWAIACSSLAGAINVGSGAPITVAGLVGLIGEILGRTDLIKLGALPYAKGDPPFVCANNHRLRTDTSWQQRFGLEDGLKRTIEWWRSRVSSSIPEAGSSSGDARGAI